MPNHDPGLVFASATSLARSIRAREVSSVEVVEACLRGSTEVNRRSTPGPPRTDALGGAGAADAELARASVHGPLHGVPFTIKDRSTPRASSRPPAPSAGGIACRTRDATVVARLKAAGGILLGKTNTPEFTWSDETDNLVYGRTNNPYDLDRSPGGSSGGAAPIVAAGGSPFDIGSDTGDSIRQPAHVCGIAGSSRPAAACRGRATRRRTGACSRVDPARTDGPPGRGPRAAPADHRRAGRRGSPRPAGRRWATRGRRSWSHLRVVCSPTTASGRPRLRRSAPSGPPRGRWDAGARVEERVPPGLERGRGLWQRMIDADGKAWLPRLMRPPARPGGARSRTRDWLAPAPLPGDALTALVERVDDLRSRLLSWIREIDLIVCPVMPQPAIHHGDSDAPLVRRHVRRGPQPDRLAGGRRPRRDVAGGAPDRCPVRRATVAGGCRAGRRGVRGSRVGRLAAPAALSPPYTRPMRFHTVIKQGDKTATGIEVPAEVVAALGSSRKPPVKVTINGYTYRSTVATMGGAFMVGVSADVRDKAGVAGGDAVDVDIELDTEKREVDGPCRLRRRARGRRGREAVLRWSLVQQQEPLRLRHRGRQDARDAPAPDRQVGHPAPRGQDLTVVA